MLIDSDHSAPTHKANKILRFQPFRRASTAELNTRLRSLTAELLERERRLEPLRRRRSAKNQKLFGAAVEAITCNLLRPELIQADVALAIPLSNRIHGGVRRYEPAAYGRHFLDLIGGVRRLSPGLLIRLGFVNVCSIGYNVENFNRSQLTTVRPTTAFLSLFADLKMNSASFAFGEQPEVIVLKNRNKKEIDYNDTVDTKRWRAEMVEINSMLRAAPLSMSREATEEGSTVVVSTEDRLLRRIFSNEDWEQGGRMHGAFWINMPRVERFELLRIGGHRICNVDWSSLHLTLAYRAVGAPLPEGDLYALDGMESSQEQRTAIKRIVSALLNAKRQLNMWPGGDAKERLSVRQYFPSTIKFRDIRSAIMSAHGPIVPLLERGMGLRFQRIESDMLIEVVLALAQKKVVALPLHDSVLVAQPNTDIASAIMSEVSRRHTGKPIPTKVQYFVA